MVCGGHPIHWLELLPGLAEGLIGLTSVPEAGHVSEGECSVASRAGSIRFAASDEGDSAALAGVAAYVIRALILSAVFCVGSRSWATARATA